MRHMTKPSIASASVLRLTAVKVLKFAVALRLLVAKAHNTHSSQAHPCASAHGSALCAGHQAATAAVLLLWALLLLLLIG